MDRERQSDNLGPMTRSDLQEQAIEHTYDRVDPVTRKKFDAATMQVECAMKIHHRNKDFDSKMAREIIGAISMKIAEQEMENS